MSEVCYRELEGSKLMLNILLSERTDELLVQRLLRNKRNDTCIFFFLGII